ncbi:MAG: hypothetical protein ACM30F_03870 [Nitrospirota bacterium]|nr:hypothetical protein [Nitrospirota bacterium]
MRIMQKAFWILAVAVSILLAACATTKFTSVWKDETYQGHPAKIMVIGVSNTPAIRKLFEDEFVKELKDHETGAIVSYTALPDQSLADKGAIITKAKEVGADTVLITKAVSRRTGTGGGPWEVYQEEYVDTETSIYDVKSGELVWTASSETWVNENASEMSRIREFVKVIVKRLSEQKLVKTEQAASNSKSY